MARLASVVAVLIGVFLTSLVWADALPTAKPERSRALHGEAGAPHPGAEGRDRRAVNIPGAVALVARQG